MPPPENGTVCGSCGAQYPDDFVGSECLFCDSSLAGQAVIADSGYTDIAHVRAGNGDQVDLHELQLTPAGTALVTAYDPIRCDLASVGGPSDGAVTDGILQEIDIRTGLVRREWTSLDHVALSESYERVASSSLAEPCSASLRSRSVWRPT